MFMAHVEGVLYIKKENKTKKGKRISYKLKIICYVQFQDLILRAIYSLHLSTKSWPVIALTGVHWLSVSVRACLLFLEGRLQYIQDGFADYILEILAHEHIQQWVQDTVETGQAGG